ncbi:nuclear transport factor 2 family protein [Georgenia satyanarayanai]|uniref:nuclear transport factor 2 family protein n=1 Tax=Georgenia satyanarayanai TaxID=860221 RepID=UPI002041BA13|nr:nuclear transport factor 2 family protein [Georgenia satyanarayanai]MCM3659732.1 nuclear transport factor 2 family protein [Georgenia satyanarayanai]
MGPRPRDEIRALLDAWAQAIVANDADRIGSFATEDWVLVGTGGTVPRERFTRDADGWRCVVTALTPRAE